MKRTRHGRCRDDAPCRAPVAACRDMSRPGAAGRTPTRQRRGRIKKGREPSVSFSGVGWAAGNATEVEVRKTDRGKESEVAKRGKLRALNDDFRRTFRGGRVMITAGVNALTHTVQRAVFQKIQAFDAFDDERDPWDNHGFVSVEHDGQTFFAKIDYYNRDLTAHSKDATDPKKTCRVMTIMLAEEY